MYQNTDRAEQIKILEKLLEVAVTVYQRIRILLALISARFEYNPSIYSHMTTELWTSAQREADQLISILSSNPLYSVEEITPDYDESVERNPETEGGTVRIRGSIITFVDRLDDEFNKSLQNIDPHGTDYVERLRDEKALYQTICLSQGYYENTKQDDPVSRVIMRRLEHIYSKVVVTSPIDVCITDIRLFIARRCNSGSRASTSEHNYATFHDVVKAGIYDCSHPGIIYTPV